MEASFRLKMVDLSEKSAHGKFFQAHVTEKALFRTVFWKSRSIGPDARCGKRAKTCPSGEKSFVALNGQSASRFKCCPQVRHCPEVSGFRNPQ